MNIKDYLIAQAEREKKNCISLLQTNLSEEDRKAVSEKLNSIDAQIDDYKTLEDGEDAKFTQTVNEMNAKMAAISEKLCENGVRVKNVNESYLDSEKAINDFADSMRNAISRKGNFQENWNEKLHTNGITIAEGSEAAYMPTPVKSLIAEKWKEYGRVLSYFRQTGAKSFYCRYNAQSQDSTDVRAKGFKSNANKTKTEQSVTLAGKLLQSEYIYKMIGISNKTIWEDDRALIDWVVSELLKQWHYEVLRAILIGDGRSSSSDDKITTIESVVRSTTDTFATKFNTAQSTTPTIEFLMDNAVLPLYDGNDDLVLFVGKADANALRKRNNPTGADATYRALTDVAAEMGLREIVVVPYLDNTTESGPRAICMHTQQYAIVGSLSPQFSSFEEFTKNQVLMRVEIPVGGGLAAPDAAIFVMNPDED